MVADKGSGFRSGMAAMVAAFLIVWPGVAQRAVAQTPTVLYNFTGPDGINPVLGVTFDSTGNLYGAASGGGSANNGTVYELMPGKSGTWTETTLISFSGKSGGSTPVAPVVFDSKGNLYGTTKLGGTNGVGVVYELSPSSAGKWKETVLHAFGGSGDGAYPVGSITIDSVGNIFGTTEGGGAYGDGTEIQGGIVFEVSPKSGGWTESVLHSFGNASDGSVPKGGVILDASGNAYGTTYKGGAHNQGAVFELSPGSGGVYSETVLHAFNESRSLGDASYPAGGLTFDSKGNLYGGSTAGFNDESSGTGGTIYKLSPNGDGTWKESLIVSLGFDQFVYPIYSNLILDSAGHIYGTEVDYAGGSLFETTGKRYKFLSQFSAPGGTRPATGSLTMDSAGNLYGATQAGGANNDGAVFEVKR